MKKYLIAEYCRGPFYMGWHLYLRDSAEKNKRNVDGSWGWIRRPEEDEFVQDYLGSLGITIRGDGTCDDDGIAQFARQFPLPRQRVGGKCRGCKEVIPLDQRQKSPLRNDSGQIRAGG